MCFKKGTVSVLVLFTFATLTASAEVELTTDQDKTLYTLGLWLSNQVSVFNLSEAELALVEAGFADGTLKREAKVKLEEWGPKLQELASQRQAAGAEKEKKAGEAFCSKAAEEKGAIKTSSGLVYVELKPGTGDSPKATDRVKVHYTGTLIDGSVFDSSVQRGQPAEFALNAVIPCWTEGVQKMKVGGKSKLTCPSSIAYGDRGAPPKIKAGATLAFEVELLDIVKPEASKPAEAPKPAAPPKAEGEKK